MKDAPFWNTVCSHEINVATTYYFVYVPSFRLSTVGSRAFPIAGAKILNSLPDDVTSAPSLPTFMRRLKTYLFRCSYNTD